jgi:hypothetical protein
MKILLKTLVPLTTIGITLGTALPLVSCSCGDKDQQVVKLWNKQEALNYIYTISNTVGSYDFSGYEVGDLAMIDWFNANIDAQIWLMFTVFWNINNNVVTYPIEYSYYSGVAKFNLINTTGDVINVSCYKKSVSLFHCNVLLNGMVDDDDDCTISKIGTTTYASITRRTIVSDPTNFDAQIVDSNIWPGVTFPTADPTV